MTDVNEIKEPLDEGRFILQPRVGYRFTSDAVALARFACDRLKSDARVLDLCSGCGIVGMLINIECGAGVLGVEIDGDMCDMSVRSASLNGLKNVGFINADIREFASRESVAEHGRFDAVVCNPPFYKADSIPSSVAPGANSELTVTFKDIALAAKMFLKNGGEFFLVHTASRLDEVLSECRAAGLTPKDLVVNANGKTFLLRCVLGGKDGLKVQTGEFKCFTS